MSNRFGLFGHIGDRCVQLESGGIELDVSKMKTYEGAYDYCSATIERMQKKRSIV